jgi:hypothetical protein
LQRTDAALVALINAFLDRAEEHAGTVMPGFTHLQTAQPVTFGHHCMAYVEMFGRDRGRFADARVRLNECPLGAAALAGTGFPIDRPAFETLCGRTMPSNEIAEREEYTLNTPIADLRRTILGRLLYNAVRRRTKSLDTETAISIMARNLIEELPLRGMVMMSGGKVTYGMMEGVLMVLNRRFLRGFATLFAEFRRKEDGLKLFRKLSGLFMP